MAPRELRRPFKRLSISDQQKSREISLYRQSKSRRDAQLRSRCLTSPYLTLQSIQPTPTTAIKLQKQINPPENATKPNVTKVRNIQICTHQSHVPLYNSILDFWNQDGQIEMVEVDSSNSLDVLSYPGKNHDLYDVSCGSSNSLKRKRENQDLSCPLRFEELNYPLPKRQKISDHDVVHSNNRSSRAESWRDLCFDLNKTDPLVELEDNTNFLEELCESSQNMDFLIANTSDTLIVDYNKLVKDAQLNMESTIIGYGTSNGNLVKLSMVQLESTESTTFGGVSFFSGLKHQLESVGGFPFDPGIERNSRAASKEYCFTCLQRSWRWFWILCPLNFKWKGNSRDRLIEDIDPENCKVMFCSSRSRPLWKFHLFNFKNQGNTRDHPRNGNSICSSLFCLHIDSSYDYISVSSFYNVGIQTLMEFLFFYFTIKNFVSSRSTVDIEKNFTNDIDQEKLEFLFCSCQKFTSIWFPYSLQFY